MKSIIALDEREPCRLFWRLLTLQSQVKNAFLRNALEETLCVLAKKIAQEGIPGSIDGEDRQLIQREVDKRLSSERS